MPIGPTHWRQDKVSDKQRALIESWGMKVPPTKGEACDLITMMLDQMAPGPSEDDDTDWDTDDNDPWDDRDW